MAGCLLLITSPGLNLFAPGSSWEVGNNLTSAVMLKRISLEPKGFLVIVYLFDSNELN